MALFLISGHKPENACFNFLDKQQSLRILKKNCGREMIKMRFIIKKRKEPENADLEMAKREALIF